MAGLFTFKFLFIISLIEGFILAEQERKKQKIHPLEFRQEVISYRESAPSSLVNLAEADLEMYINHCVS